MLRNLLRTPPKWAWSGSGPKTLEQYRAAYKPTPRFLQAVERVLGHEGGYVFNPNDRGGETKWGISKRSYPQLHIPSLTREDAQAIYFWDFWRAVAGDAIACAGIAGRLFDLAVNSGPKTAAKLTQQALRYLGHPTKVDGIIGVNTLRDINVECRRRDHERDLAVAILMVRGRLFVNLTEKDPRQRTFSRGWARRLWTEMCVS